MPKISVIIPIYNSEKYLHQCIDSILCQTLTDIEILLMDDGSSDGSAVICDEYAQKDKRIRVIHKENSGYGSTINQAIRLAAGEYVGIIEADDFTEPDMYEKLYANATKNKTDVTKCYFYQFNQYRPKPDHPYLYASDLSAQPTGVFNVHDYPKILTYHSAIWAAIYRTKFIQNILLRETPGASYQDFPFTFEALLKAKRLSIVPAYLMHYRKEPHQNSSTAQPGAQVLLLVDHMNYVIDFMKKNGTWQSYKDEFFYHATKCLHGYFIISRPDVKEAYYHALRTFYTPFQNQLSFRYFEEHLKQFVIALWHQDKDYLFQINQPVPVLRKILIKSVSVFIRDKQKRKTFRNKLLKHM